MTLFLSKRILKILFPSLLLWTVGIGLGCSKGADTPPNPTASDSETAGGADQDQTGSTEETDETTQEGLRSGPGLRRDENRGSDGSACSDSNQVWENGACRNRRCDREGDGLTCAEGTFCNASGQCDPLPQCVSSQTGSNGPRLNLTETESSSTPLISTTPLEKKKPSGTSKKKTDSPVPEKELQFTVTGLTDEAAASVLIHCELDSSGRPLIKAGDEEGPEINWCATEGNCAVCSDHPENCPGYNAADFDIPGRSAEVCLVKIPRPTVENPTPEMPIFYTDFASDKIRGRLVTTCHTSQNLFPVKQEQADRPTIDESSVRISETRPMAEIQTVIADSATGFSIKCDGEDPVEHTGGRYFCEVHENFTKIEITSFGHAGLTDSRSYCLEMGRYNLLKREDLLFALVSSTNVSPDYDGAPEPLEFQWSASQKYRVTRLAPGENCGPIPLPADRQPCRTGNVWPTGGGDWLTTQDNWTVCEDPCTYHPVSCDLNPNNNIPQCGPGEWPVQDVECPNPEELDPCEYWILKNGEAVSCPAESTAEAIDKEKSSTKKVDNSKKGVQKEEQAEAPYEGRTGWFLQCRAWNGCTDGYQNHYTSDAERCEAQPVSEPGDFCVGAVSSGDESGDDETSDTQAQGLVSLARTHVCRNFNINCWTAYDADDRGNGGPTSETIEMPFESEFKLALGMNETGEYEVTLTDPESYVVDTSGELNGRIRLNCGGGPIGQVEFSWVGRHLRFVNEYDPEVTMNHGDAPYLRDQYGEVAGKITVNTEARRKEFHLTSHGQDDAVYGADVEICCIEEGED